MLEPASKTYAGYAWTYLRRNLGYGHNYEHVTSNCDCQAETSHTHFKFQNRTDTQAHKWGLETFESPQAAHLDAQVFWRQDAFPGALTVLYHTDSSQQNNIDFFVLSNFDCLKQHFIKADGTRISVLKSQEFWLQIAGRPSNIMSEDEPFSVVMNGGKGARRRIDALRQLTSLSRDGTKNFKLLGRERAFSKLHNGLMAFDIKSGGGSYKDVAIVLFGIEKVQQDWDSTGCYLKGRAVRAVKFAERMVAQDYQSLLPKKTL